MVQPMPLTHALLKSTVVSFLMLVYQVILEKRPLTGLSICVSLTQLSDSLPGYIYQDFWEGPPKLLCLVPTYLNPALSGYCHVQAWCRTCSVCFTSTLHQHHKRLTVNDSVSAFIHLAAMCMLAASVMPPGESV